MADDTDWIVPLPDPQTSCVLMQKLIVSDADRSMVFYTEAIGMKVLHRLDYPGGSEIILGFSDSPTATKLVVSSANESGNSLLGVPRMSGCGGERFCNLIFQVPDMPAVMARIRKFGGLVTMEPHRTHEHRWFLLGFAKDPDQHVLEFLQFATFDQSLPLFDPTATTSDRVDLGLAATDGT